MDQTWFKVRILLPFENDLISKWREAVMDILEHNTVSGNPKVALMHDSHLLTDFYKGLAIRETPNDVSASPHGPFLVH